MTSDLSPRELAAVLAGLRLFQRALAALPPEIADLATNGGAVHPLSDAEVDTLCARLDAADAPRSYRVVWQIDVDAASPLEAALRGRPPRPAGRPRLGLRLRRPPEGRRDACRPGR